MVDETGCDTCQTNDADVNSLKVAMNKQHFKYQQNVSTINHKP